MEDIYSSVNFPRNFGANCCWEKIHETRKCLLLDDYTGKQGLVPRLSQYKSYFMFKKLCLDKFLCNLKMLERSYTDLRKAKNAIFAKMAILK